MKIFRSLAALLGGAALGILIYTGAKAFFLGASWRVLLERFGVDGFGAVVTALIVSQLLLQSKKEG